MVGVNEMAGLAIAAVIIVFLVSLGVVVMCRKRYTNKDSKHFKTMIGGVVVMGVVWLIMLALFAWCWWWVIKSAPVGDSRNMLIWLFGFELLAFLLWVIFFFVCDSIGASLVILALAIFMAVAIAVQSAIIQNYWIMAYAIVLAVLFVITAILMGFLCKHCGKNKFTKGQMTLLDEPQQNESKECDELTMKEVTKVEHKKQYKF